MTFASRIAIWAGSGFGIGFLPFAPGTWGSLLALPLVWICYTWGGLLTLAFFTIATCLISWWTTAPFEKVYGEDPGPLVMDEIAGQSFCLLLLFAFWNTEQAIFTYTAGFLFFRLFDITKILGSESLQRIGGGAGVLLDDLLAGFYAHLATGIVILIFI